MGILFDRHHERIFRYLWMRLSSFHQAEDLTGEVFARMVASLPRYQEEAPFPGMALHMAHNILVDQYRKTNGSQLI